VICARGVCSSSTTSAPTQLQSGTSLTGECDLSPLLQLPTGTYTNGEKGI